MTDDDESEKGEERGESDEEIVLGPGELLLDLLLFFPLGRGEQWPKTKGKREADDIDRKEWKELGRERAEQDPVSIAINGYGIMDGEREKACRRTLGYEI